MATGVQTRLWRVFALQLVVISIATVLGVLVVFWIVESVLSREAINGEAEHYWSLYAENPEQPLPDTNNMRGYLAPGGDVSGVPAALRDRPPGWGRVDFDGRQPLLHVSDGPGGRLYLVLEQGQITDLTLYFGVLPGLVVLLLIYATSFIVYRMSQQAVSPMVKLAGRLEDFAITAQGIRVELDDLRPGADAEVLTMMNALDQFTERLTAFIDRERTFTRDASHELRTPLAVLKGSLDLLQRNDDRPAQDADALTRMRRTVSDMEALLETLLLLARGDEVGSPSEPVSVNEVVTREIELLGQLADSSRNQLKVDECAALHVPAPRKAIGIVLSNLLRNALSYTRNGEVQVEVHDRGVRIKDTGIGMSDDDLSRVFDPFFRADSAREGDAERGSSGHGLGLSIVRRLCSQYGWSLAVESTPGQGTVINVAFF